MPCDQALEAFHDDRMAGHLRTFFRCTGASSVLTLRGFETSGAELRSSKLINLNALVNMSDMTEHVLQRWFIFYPTGLISGPGSDLYYIITVQVA